MSSRDKIFLSLPEVIRVPRTDAIYNCHSYLTKVPVFAISPFIEALTQPGEVVLDPFAGSGMTGLAATMCGRRALLNDVSVLGQHISEGYLARTDHEELRSVAHEVIEGARKAMGELYQTHRNSDGNPVEIVRTIWSALYRCPKCSADFVYFDLKTKTIPPRCASCGQDFSKRNWTKVSEVPVRTVVRNSAGRITEQEVTSADKKKIKQARTDPRLEKVPSAIIEKHREMFRRSALEKHGLTETKRFFSPRNAIALFELRTRISRIDSAPIRQKLLFAFTAILARASKRYQWGPKRPLNAQNQTYYIAPIFYEWNVFELFSRKVQATIRADKLVFPVETSVQYRLGSASSLDFVADTSVDYVFTDPPFGSNIFYSDMNLFHEAWLGSFTAPEHEAVIQTGKNRAESAKKYEELLKKAFKETYRVLKPDRFLSVVFGNSDGKLWKILVEALRFAGFDPSLFHIAILDKGQRSVKGLNSGAEKVLTVDLVITAQKSDRNSGKTEPRPLKDGDLQSLVLEARQKLGKNLADNPSYLYAATIREAIRQNISVEQIHLGRIFEMLSSIAERSP